MHDRTTIIFDGKSPNRLACDTTLRRMPAGRLNYPDGFLSADRQWLHFAFDDNRHRAVYYRARLPSRNCQELYEKDERHENGGSANENGRGVEMPPIVHRSRRRSRGPK